MKNLAETVLTITILLSLVSCTHSVAKGETFKVSIILIGFDNERVELTLNGETIFNETVEISDPSVGIGNAMTVQVNNFPVLSVDSESTSFTETLELSGDANVLVVRYADQFVVRPVGEPLQLD